MFRFTIRDVLGLMVVGGMSCVVAMSAASYEPAGAVPAALILFSFGGAYYVGGIVIGRWGQSATPNRP
jgi:hypothetical protein